MDADQYTKDLVDENRQLRKRIWLLQKDQWLKTMYYLASGILVGALLMYFFGEFICRF